jgi:hypothetical protein
MHTIQLLLIQAETPQQAFEFVETALTSEGAVAWSDWHYGTDASTMNFAGRWEHQIFLTPEQEVAKENGTLSLSDVPNHLCYADNPELAEKVLSEFIQYRKTYLTENLPDGTLDLEKLVKDYNPNEETKYEMELWKIKKLTQLLDDEWFWQTAFYDITGETGSLFFFQERCAKNPEKQFLIPVDFHH